MKLRAWLLTQTALSSGLIFGVGMGGAMAADVVVPVVVAPPPPPPVVQLPAVSGFNFKIDISGGRLSPPFFGPGGLGFRVQGAVSIPIGHSLGLQLDAVYARILGLPAWHGAAHAFWRDPARALLGAYASYDAWAGISRTRIAAQGEVYLGRLTFEGMLGVEFGTLPTGWFGAADVAFYPMDNLRLSIGVQHAFIGNALTGGIEYQFYNTDAVGVAGFVEGAIGTGGYQKLLGGIRLYFGQGETLIERHRQDDPRINADEMGCGVRGTDGAVAVDTLICAVDAQAD